MPTKKYKIYKITGMEENQKMMIYDYDGYVDKVIFTMLDFDGEKEDTKCNFFTFNFLLLIKSSFFDSV